jgi:HEAT repeat protein
LPDANSTSDELIERLGSDDRTTRRLACDEAIERLAQEAGLMRDLLRALQDGEPYARFSIAFVLFHAGRPSLRLLPTLLDALEFDDGDLRWSATHMLTTLGRMQPEVFPVLLHEVRASTIPLRRRMGLYVLRELAPEREESRAVFLELLDDPDPEARHAALSSLAKITEPDASCVDRVLSILHDDVDPRMRRIAAVVLPDVVARRPEALEGARRALTRAVDTTDRSLQRAAQAALTRLDQPALEPSRGS